MIENVQLENPTELLYRYEHISCLNFDKRKKPNIEIKKILGNQFWEFPVEDNKIIFITKGKIRVSCGSFQDKFLDAGKMILVCSGTDFKAWMEEDTSVTIFRLREHVQLCDRYSLERLLKEGRTEIVQQQEILDIKEILWDYLKVLHKIIEDGLKCINLFEIKSKELFFILRAYYTKDELLAFFFPMLSKDTKFSDIILLNYRKVKSVRELAELTHYSVSGFEKRFKKAFNMPPYQWLNQQKAKNIYHEINCSNKTFKEISLEYGFASPAHLNDFCKSQFGETPGKLRKQNYAG